MSILAHGEVYDKTADINHINFYYLKILTEYQQMSNSSNLATIVVYTLTKDHYEFMQFWLYN